MSAPLPRPVHDPDALLAARAAIRDAHAAICRLSQADPTIRVLLVELAEMCAGLETEIDAMEDAT